MRKKKEPWKECFKQFKAAFEKLEGEVHLLNHTKFVDDREYGLFQSGVCVQYIRTMDMAVCMLNEFMRSLKLGKMRKPKGVIEKSLQIGLLTHKRWMDAWNDREKFLQMSEKEEEKVYQRIVSRYILLYQKLINSMEERMRPTLFGF